jgi:Sec-independent protein translocase protein TatA
MDFLGIGPLEFVLILVLGFLFFGPEKLPGIASRVGKIYHDLNRTAGEMHKALTEEVSLKQDMDKKLAAFNSSQMELEPPPEKEPGPTGSRDG